jgi:hypothetical protein
MALTAYDNYVNSMDMSKLELQESLNTVAPSLAVSWPTASSSSLWRSLLVGLLAGLLAVAVLRAMR